MLQPYRFQPKGKLKTFPKIFLKISVILLTSKYINDIIIAQNKVEVKLKASVRVKLQNLKI